jgi:Flp pilus assembly pilin Flp
MLYRSTGRVLRDVSGTTKTTYALLGAIVAIAGVAAIGGAGSKLGERIAASDTAPEPAAIPAMTEAPAAVEAAPVIEIASEPAPVPEETAPVAILAAPAPQVGPEVAPAPVGATPPMPVAAARAEQARLDAIRDAVSIALATAAIERAAADADPDEAAWIPASGTLDIRPLNRPAD